MRTATRSLPGGVGERVDLGALALWTLLCAIAASMAFYGANRPLPWTLLSAAALAVFTTGLLAAPLPNDGPRLRALLAPGALFLGVLAWGLCQAGAFPLGSWESGGVTRALSLDHDASLQTVMRMSAYAACFWIAVRAGASLSAARSVVAAIGLAGAVFSAIGVFAHLAGFALIAFDDVAGDRLRLSGTFANPNSFAFVAATALLANLAAIDRRLTEALGPMPRWREAVRALMGPSWPFALGLIICLVALFLTGSRGGVVTAGFALAVYLVLRRARATTTLSRRGGLAIVAGLACVLAIGLTLGSDQIASRLSATEGLDAGRAEIFATVWRAIAEHPSLGVGLGAFEEGVKPYLRGDLAQLTWAKAHNLYLELMLELGLPAFLAWAAAMLLITRRLVIGALQRQRGLDLTIFCAAILALGATHSLVDFPLQMPSIAALFAVILGLGWAQSWSSRSNRHSSRTIAT